MRRQAFLILFFCAAVSAQVTIDGDVVHRATGEPVAGARVPDCLATQPPYVETDAGGHFRLSGTFSSERPRCLLTVVGPDLLQHNQWLSIGSPETHIAVRVEVTKAAVITGKVLDENGWGIPAMVWPLRFYNDNGVRRVAPAASVEANDRGEFRIARLTPGRYYLYASPRLADYLPAWYPSVPDEEHALPVDLADGQQASVELHLAPGGGVEVRGQVTAPAGFQPGQMNFIVRRVAEWFESGVPEAKLAADGSFVVRHVPPGRYIFMATPSPIASWSAPPAYLAWQEVEVKTENVDGVRLNIGPTTVRDLKGTVVTDGSVKPQQVRIALNGVATAPRLAAKVEADGAFAIPGVWPGHYQGYATVEGGQPLSFLFGQREILRRLLEFDGTDAPLRVTVAGTFVPIAGTVAGSDGKPVVGARVVFVRSGSTYAPSPVGNPGIPFNAGTDQNGAIISAALPPGAYRVYVIENPDAVDRTMEDPQFLQSQEKAFPPVTVTVSGTAPLRLVLPQR
ncbi:MAG: carboxypeptidase-like regulatory domain-containing protein [Bryobacteraceae bacterium]|jgi:hypothetical protein